jgi:hypothetical protein
VKFATLPGNLSGNSRKWDQNREQASMIRTSQTVLRSGFLLLSTALAISGLWLLGAELSRPAIPYFPADQAAADVAASHRAGAAMSASIGVIRGDLWADYATSLAAALLGNADATPTDEGTSAAQNTAVTVSKAASLAPADSRVWLLLAMIDSRLKGRDREAAESLKMSYYTGPNETALIPSRLLFATRSSAIADPDMQDLVRREIRTIVTHGPQLRPTLSAAYRNASPAGRRFIDDEVGALDPNLLTAIRTQAPPR